jgi:cytochrome d ubiquinol oxidase subunit I
LVPIGFVSIWAGWVLAETGRQPWLVYGQLPTAAAVSALKPWSVLTSLTVFVVLYLARLGTYVRYVVRAVREGPGDGPIVEPAAPSLPHERRSGLAPAS